VLFVVCVGLHEAVDYVKIVVVDIIAEVDGEIVEVGDKIVGVDDEYVATLRVLVAVVCVYVVQIEA
jgi:hypothetical protein